MVFRPDVLGPTVQRIVNFHADGQHFACNPGYIFPIQYAAINTSAGILRATFIFRIISRLSFR